MTAPSGYGKTTAVADWARSASSVAWLSLNTFDSDPGRLAQGVLSALRQMPGAAAAALAGVDPQLDDPAIVHDVLSRVLAGARPVHLVFDDAHRAGPGWRDGLLGSLVEQLPGALRTVLVGTSQLESPVTRLGLGDEEGLIGADVLAFTRDEIEILAAGCPEGAAGDADAIIRESAGWPIAVRLMPFGGGGTLRPGTGSLAAPLQDYVRDRVLRGLPDELVRFLLGSIACAPLTAEVAEAVTGHPDATALLDESVRRGLFVDRFPSEGGAVFRWHPVFARECVAILRDRDSQRLQDVRRSAATHVRNSDPLHAIDLALQAGDRGLARQVLLSTWIGLVVSAGAVEVDRACVKLLDIAPDDVSVQMIRACALDVAGQHTVARELFKHAEAAADGSADDVPVRRVARLFLVDDRGHARDAAAAVRELLVTSDHPSLADSAAIHYLLGWAEIRHRTSAELPVEYFTVAARQAQATGRAGLAQRALGHLAFALTWAGRLAAARDVLDKLGADRTDNTPWGYYAGGSASAAAGYVAYWSGDTERAQHPFERVVAGGSSRTSFAGVARMMIAFAGAESGDTAPCRRAAIGIHDIPANEAHGVSWPAFRQAAIAMLEEAVGDRDHAIAIARKFVGSQDLPVVCVALAGVLRRAGDATTALEMLRALREFSGLSYVRVATIATAALVRRAAGDDAGAHDMCEAALEIAAVEGIGVIFGHREEQLRLLLADHLHFGTRFPDEITPYLADNAVRTRLAVLTGRELAVFRQLQTRRTISEIAVELSVSVNTVKTHQRSIYRKLGVGSRREAVLAAL